MISLPPTSHQAQLLLDHLDNIKAAQQLPPEEYRDYWRAKYWLIEQLVNAERREQDQREQTDLRQFTRAA